MLWEGAPADDKTVNVERANVKVGVSLNHSIHVDQCKNVALIAAVHKLVHSAQFTTKKFTKKNNFILHMKEETNEDKRRKKKTNVHTNLSM